MNEKKKSTTIQLTEEQLEKLNFIASHNERSQNKQVAKWIKDDYEELRRDFDLVKEV